MLVLVYVRNKSSYEHVFNFEWLSRQSCLNVARTILPSRLDFCLWGWMKSKVYKRKVDTRHKLFPRILDTDVSIKNLKFNSDEQLRDFGTWFANLIEVYSLFPTWYTAFLFTYNICYLLSSTCFRPHRPIIRRSKLYMQPMVFSHSADVFVVLPHDKDICRGGEHHRLHVQFRPPDDGPVRPETCRGKKIADIVRRQKSSVSSWK